MPHPLALGQTVCKRRSSVMQNYEILGPPFGWQVEFITHHC